MLATRGILKGICKRVGPFGHRSIVNLIETPGDYKKGVKADGLVVAQFSATWCKPCQKAKVFVEELSNELQNVSFLEVDVDNLPEIANEESVKSIPLFKVYKNGTLVEEHIGGDKEQLKTIINKHNN